MTSEHDPNAPWSYVRFETSVGTFVVELYHKHAPRTCYNIAALADAGYYNGTVFHRIIRDFMVRIGETTGTPWQMLSFPLENAHSMLLLLLLLLPRFKVAIPPPRDGAAKAYTGANLKTK